MAANQNSSIATQSLKFMKQKYDYFLVLDFEATCDDKKKLVPQVSSCLFGFFTFTIRFHFFACGLFKIFVIL